jgi:PAS domain S-box-containing protein
LRQEVADRQGAEAALRESEARYRILVDISPDAITLTDRDARVLMANPQARMLFGLPPDVDLQGESSLDFVAPEDRERARSDMQETLASGRPGSAEYTLKRCDGTQFAGEVSASLVPDRAGAPRAFISIIRDISERRQAQILLQRRQATLELLYQAGQVFNSTLESDQVLTTVLDEVRRGLDALVCSIWLTDPVTGESVCRQATGPECDLVRGWRLPPGKGIAGWIIEHGETVISTDVQADPRHAAEVDQKTQLPLRSMLAVPLRGKRGTVGVIEVAHGEADHFKAEDRTFLELLSFTAVSAIENAELYEQAQREIAQRRKAEETLSAANQRLQALSRQLVEVQETERRRLALELHDELGQMLNSIKLSLDLMPIDPASESQEPLRRARRLITQLIQQVRQLALDLRPAMLDDLGLVPALKSFFRQQTAQTAALRLRLRPLPIGSFKRG